MKTILVLCFGILMYANIHAHVYYDKTLGFFNHYKEVSQTNMNNGDIFMECHDPGWTRCRPQALLVISFDGVDTPVSDEEFNSIDETITRAVIGGNNGGRFVYGEKFFVSYTYDEKTDKLSTNIYTLAEAAHYNLL